KAVSLFSTSLLRPVVAFPLCVSQSFGAHGALLSFPTRRSSDLLLVGLPTISRPGKVQRAARSSRLPIALTNAQHPLRARTVSPGDRKSTRLNSSHVKISYAVFCLKKKMKTTNTGHHARHRSADY